MGRTAVIVTKGIILENQSTSNWPQRKNTRSVAHSSEKWIRYCVTSVFYCLLFQDASTSRNWLVLLRLNQPNSISVKTKRRKSPLACINLLIYSLVNEIFNSSDNNASNWIKSCVWNKVFAAQFKVGLEKSRAPGILNFVRKRLIFEGPRYGTLRVTLLTPTIEVAPRFWNTCEPVIRSNIQALAENEKNDAKDQSEQPVPWPTF